MSEVFQQLRRVRREVLLILSDVFEDSPVVQLAAGINMLAQFETDPNKRIDRSAFGRVAFTDRPIAMTEATDDIKRLEREAGGIDAAMT